PENIIDAAIEALHQGWTHYGPSAGLPELRQTIAGYISQTRGVKVTSDEVVVVPGGKPVIFFTILALVDEGDEVIYPNPGFPIYQSMVDYIGGNAVPIRLREDRDFSLDVDELASLITDHTKLIILNSPHNPTGGVLNRQEIHDIAAAMCSFPDLTALKDSPAGCPKGPFTFFPTSRRLAGNRKRLQMRCWRELEWPAYRARLSVISAKAIYASALPIRLKT